MRALTVEPGRAKSIALTEMPEPEAGPGELLVKTLAVGVCGTDREIIGGAHGEAPPGQQRLVLGHESLGAVMRAPNGSSFRLGDLVAGVVRRPDPVPCPSCAAGEWDMCQNGLFTERGIKGADGYGSEFFTLEERFAIKVPASLRQVGVLVEPASVVAKAWEQVDSISQVVHAYRPSRALITGAGPVGLLAALLAVQRGHEVVVFDRLAAGPKPHLVRDIGATYCSDLSSLRFEPQLVVECTGAGQVVFEVVRKVARNGIVCLAGLSSGKRVVEFSAGELNDRLVLENTVVFGSVNANRRHYAAAVAALERAPLAWLERLITRRVAPQRFADAFTRGPEDVKVIFEWAA